MIYKHIAVAQGSENSRFSSASGGDVGKLNKIGDYEYASLEPDSYDIDNPRLMNTGQEIAYNNFILTDDNGFFETPIVINTEFDEFVELKGISFSADAKILKVGFDLFFQGNLVASYLEENLQDNYFVFEKRDVDEIKITIYSTNRPNRFLNIYGIIFGRVWDLTENIKTVKMTNNVSLSGREFPIDTINIVASNFPKGINLEFEQQLSVSTDDGLLLYTFYLNSFKFSDDEDVVTLDYSDVGSLLEEDFVGEYYQNATVKEVVDDILDGTGIEWYDVYGFGDTIVRGFVPNVSRRNALIYVANATGYKIYKHPYIDFRKQSNVEIAKFDDNNVFSGSLKVTTDKPAKEVKLAIYPKKPITYDEYETVFEDEVEAGTYDLILDEPVYVEGVDFEKSFVAKVPTTDAPATISGGFNTSNSLWFRVPQNSNVVIKFKKFWNIDDYTEISKQIENANLYKKLNTEKIDSFTLIANDKLIKPQTRLNDLFDYYRINEYKNIKVVWDKWHRIDGIVDIYGKKHRIRKLVTSFDDVAELEVETLVD